MQSLKEKLRQLHPAASRGDAQPIKPPENNLGSVYFCGELFLKIQKNKNLVIREKRYPVNFYYGRQSLEELRLLDSQSLSFIAGINAFNGLTASDILFIDTETTGLAGGTGTYVFLIGLGRFIDEEFVVKQFLLTDLCDEPELLQAFIDEISLGKCFVTFNGKSFDLPLLKTRFLLNRMDTELDGFAHIDLLIPVRRLWKNSLPCCSLAEVEAKILDYRRINDLPGWAVPKVYFDFLRSQNFPEILPVLRHNVQDILSLAAMTACLAQVYKEKSYRSDINPLWMFRIFCNIGKPEEALDYSLPKEFLSSSVTSSTLRLLLEKAYLLKRLGKHKEAASLFEQLLESKQLGRFACEELAKYYEHQLKNYRKALEIMINFEKRFEIRALFKDEADKSVIGDYEWEKRKLRLLRKINRFHSPKEMV